MALFFIKKLLGGSMDRIIKINEEKKAQVKKALTLAFKCVNAIQGKRLRSIRTQPIQSKYGNSDKVLACWYKQVREFETKLGYLLDDLNTVLPYLEWVNQVQDLGIKKSECKGQLLEVDYITCNLLTNLIYKCTAFTESSEHQVGRFTFHEILHEFINLMTVRHALVYGLPPKIETVFLKMIRNKQTSFFKNGFIPDLFVVDACSEINNTLKAIKCSKDRVSTHSVEPGYKLTAEEASYYDLYIL